MGISTRARVRALLVSLTVGAAALAGVGSTASGSAGVMGAAAAPPLPVSAERAVSAAWPLHYQDDPSVAWNGRVYLVVWTEQEPGNPNSLIYAARVSRGGAVLDPGGILVSSGTTDSPNYNPEVSAGNGRFLVVWEVDRSPEDIRGALVTGSGDVLRDWWVQNAEDNQYDPDVAWNGRQWLVVFADIVDGEPADIYGTRVRWSGLTLDGCNADSCPGGLAHGIDVNDSAPGDQGEPGVTAIRSGPGAGLFQVVWTDPAFGDDANLRGGRLSADGVPLDGTGFPVSGAVGSQDQTVLAANGATVLAAWTDERRASAPDVFGTRLRPTLDPSTTPAPLPPAGTPVSARAGEQFRPDAAAVGAGFLVTWNDDRSGSSDVYAARVGSDGALADPSGVPVAATDDDEYGVAVAGSDTRSLVAYTRIVPSESGGEDSYRLFFRLVG